MMVKTQVQITKICDGTVTCIIPHPIRQNCILTTGSNGKVSVYNLLPFQLIHQFKICNDALTFVFAHGQQLLVGSSFGQLVVIKINGQIIKRIKLHQDYISSICESNNNIATTSYDGKLKLLNKQTLEVQTILDLQLPIWSSKYYKQKIYTCGNPSFCIDCHTLNKQKLKNFNRFQVVNQKLYGCSDERGFTYMQKNENVYIPCQFIIGLKNKILLFSQQCCTQVIHTKVMKFNCKRIKVIHKGLSITSGTTFNQMIVLSDNQGNIYKLFYNTQESQSQIS